MPRWTGMDKFNSDEHYIYYCGQASLTRNGLALIVNKRVWNAVLGSSLKNNRLASVHFQGKPSNITVHQVYALTTNAKEAEVERFYEDLQDLLELTPKKRCPFHHRGLECKNRKSRDTWSTKWTRVKGNKSFAERMHWSKQTPSSNNTRDDSTHGHHQVVNTEIRLIIFLASEDRDTLNSQQQQHWELTMAQIIKSLLPYSDLNWRKQGKPLDHSGMT